MNNIIAAGSLVVALTVALAASGITAPAMAPVSVPMKDTIASRLMTFDVLDFDVFTNQKWDRLKESHSKDITVVWPDGHETHGIDKHIEDLKFMFSYAPDTRIQVHPVKFGTGEWTAVIGVM